MPCFKLNAKHRFVVLDKYDHTYNHAHTTTTRLDSYSYSITHTNIIKIKFLLNGPNLLFTHMSYVID